MIANDVLWRSVSCLTSGLIWAGWVVALQTASCAVTDAMSWRTRCRERSISGMLLWCKKTGNGGWEVSWTSSLLEESACFYLVEFWEPWGLKFAHKSCIWSRTQMFQNDKGWWAGSRSISAFKNCCAFGVWPSHVQQHKPHAPCHTSISSSSLLTTSIILLKIHVFHPIFWKTIVIMWYLHTVV